MKLNLKTKKQQKEQLYPLWSRPEHPGINKAQTGWKKKKKEGRKEEEREGGRERKRKEGRKEGEKKSNS